jgi:glycosyltransferase involved in cell wall biosynthesis
VHAPFAYEHLGVLSSEELAWAYSQATVGLVLGLTNYSLIPQEMLACGLPAVDLAGTSAAEIFGADGPVALAEPSPTALADTIVHLLDDAEEQERRRREGIAYTAARTWDDAADRVEAGLREALRLRAT